jgi:hypothetical protein
MGTLTVPFASRAGESRQVLGRRERHRVRSPLALAGGAVRRGDARAALERVGVRVGLVGHEVEQAVDPVGVAVTHAGDEVAVAVDALGDADAGEVRVVVGESGGR